MAASLQDALERGRLARDADMHASAARWKRIANNPYCRGIVTAVIAGVIVLIISLAFR